MTGITEESPPLPTTTHSLRTALDCQVIAEILRRLGTDADNWRRILLDAIEVSNHAEPDALREAAEVIAPLPDQKWWDGQWKYQVEMAYAIVDAGIQP